jgi:hypothetical protein
VPGHFAHIDAVTRRDIEALARSIQPSTQKPRDVRLPYPQARWTNLSNLQKAVRRGDVPQAVESAERLHHHDATKVRRRLAVIALEDLSYGDLQLTATALTYAVVAAKQVSGADLECCLGLAEQMASTTKDRILAELVGAAVDSPKRRDSILEIAHSGVQECAALYRDEDADPRDRSVAGLALAGALTLNGKRAGTRDRNALIAAAMDMGLPEAVQVILECSLKIGGEMAALAVNVPVLYRAMRAQVVRIERAPLPEATVIEGLISVACDQHTRAGLRALHTYRQKWRPLAQFLRKNVGDPRAAIKTLAFRAEGSALDREIVCPLGDQVFARNEEAQCDAIGMDYAALPAAKHLFLAGLPVLNALRQQAIAAELRALGIAHG